MLDRALAFLIHYKRTHDGNAPSWSELAEHLGCSTAKAGGLLYDLERTGAIRLRGNGQLANRAIEIVGGRWMPPEYPQDVDGRDVEVLRAIVAHKLAHDGVSPTQAAIAETVGAWDDLAYSSRIWNVQRHIESLEKAGYVRTGEGRRDLEVVGGRWTFNAAANRRSRERSRLERIRDREL